MEPTTKGKYGELLKKGASVTQNIIPIIAKAVAKKYIDTDTVVESVAAVAKNASKALKSEIDDYVKRRDGIKSFRETLEDFIINANSGEPIVFIIDELDRCRPSYAVELLEQVKHLFSVSGIVFVLAIDKEQLGHIIRGMYGSDKFNASEYLRRFIDLEYAIPAVETDVYVKHLYYHFDLDSFFSSGQRRNIGELEGDKENVMNFAAYLFGENNISLRLQEKIFAQLSIILKAFGTTSYVHPHVLVGLCLIKNKLPEFYSQIKSKSLTTQAVLDKLNESIKSSPDQIKNRHFIYFEAGLAYLYQTYISGHSNSGLIVPKSSSGGHIITVNSGYDISPSRGDFISFLQRYSEKHRYSEVNIGKLMEKIDLLSHINL